MSAMHEDDHEDGGHREPARSPCTREPTQIANSGAPVNRLTAASDIRREQHEPLCVVRQHQSGFAYSQAVRVTRIPTCS